MTEMTSEEIVGEENDAITAYIHKHKITELLQGLVEGLLKEKPKTHPRAYFAHRLRMYQLKESRRPSISEFDVREASKASEVPGWLLVNLFEATKKITAEIVPKDTISIIMQETIKLLNCERVSLFIHDKRIDMLVLNASNLEQPIRVKPGQGIAGYVFRTQETVNIPSCYEDKRFDQTFDTQTGFKTRNLLTMPITDVDGSECMGVLQAINKLDDRAFDRIDEILMENLTQHCTIALRNAEIYRTAIVTSERATGLLHMMQSLSQNLGLQSMILTIATHASELVQASKCTAFLVDDKKQQLWSVATDSGQEIRIPKSVGIAGECATDAKVIVIADAYEDSRFNKEVDAKTGYQTKSILAVPILRRNTAVGQGGALGVIQMINKTEFDGAVGKFDDEDIQVMETFATFAASKLEVSSLLAAAQAEVESEASKAFDLPVRSLSQRSSKRRDTASRSEAILENEEDEGA